MILDDKSLYYHYTKLLNHKGTPATFIYKAEIVVNETENLNVLKVLNYDTMSNFSTDTADYKFITVLVPYSTKRLIDESNRRVMKVILYRGVASLSYTIQPGTLQKQTFKAVPVNNNSSDVNSPPGGRDGSRTDDMSQLYEITLQLVEEGLDEFRLMTVGGVYKETRTDDLIKFLLSTPLKSFKNNMGFGVKIVKGSNNEIYKQIPIGFGTKLIDIPRYIQMAKGVYSFDIGYYMQNGQWYVYPLYDYSRYLKEDRRMTIINVPSNEMAGIDNSFFVEGNEITIFSTGISLHNDTSEHGIQNVGDSIIATKSKNLFDKFYQIEKGIPKIAKDNNVMMYNLDKRDTDFRGYCTTPTIFSANPWRDSSDITQTMGSIFTCFWESSRHDLVYPGMPVRVIYKADGQIRSLYGTILGISSKVTTLKKIPSDLRYISTSGLTIFLQTINDKPKSN